MDFDLDDEDGFLASFENTKPIQVKEEAEPEHKGISITRTPIIEEKPEPVAYDPPELNKRLAVVDLETDPFKRGRNPKVFACGFALDGFDYVYFWGKNCVNQFFKHLVKVAEKLYAETGEEICVYAHNGGKFDFNFFDDWIDPDCSPFLIDTRKVKMSFAGIEFRDSYSILPVALKKLKTAKWAKLDIEIDKMEAEVRELYKDEILKYLEADCFTLLEVVRDFIARFGWRLTIASTALPLLQSFHGFENMLPSQDTIVRDFYKGGRVQCFKTGLIRGDYMMIDANSMYPYAMANFDHPVSALPRRTKDLDDCDFAYIEAENFGCLGVGDGLGYDFTHTRGKFFATIHEIRAGLDTDTLRIKRLISGYRFAHHDRFDKFVDHYYGLRLQSKAEGDTAGVEFYKLILNSAYGKLAMNTARYKTFRANPTSPLLPTYGTELEFAKVTDENGIEKNVCLRSPNGWRPEMASPGLSIYSRPKYGAGTNFLNVAAAASITGAARSVLWRAVCNSVDPLYCDTDSIICRSFGGETDDKKLGAWKVEARGDAVMIAGKKMYAFMSEARPADYDPKKHEYLEIEGVGYYLIKKAHKGVQLRADQILEIVSGSVIEHESDAPTYKLDGRVLFQKRKIRMTTGDPVQMELML